MSTTSVHCPVLGASVVRVLNLRGEATSIICPEFEAATKGCRLKKGAFAGGPLSQLLERVQEHTLDSRSPLCGLA